MSQQTFSTPIYLHTMTGLGSWPGEATFQHPLALGQPPAPRLLSKTEGPLFGPWTRYAWLLRKEHNIPSARHVGQRKCADHGPQLLPNKHLADRLWPGHLTRNCAQKRFHKKKQPSMAMVLVWQGGIVPLSSVLLLKNSSCVKSWTSNLGLSGFLLNCECEVRQVDVKSPNFDFGIDWILCCIFRIITESLPKQSKVNWILSEQGHASNQTCPIDSSIHGQFYQSFDLVGGFNPIKKYEWN